MKQTAVTRLAADICFYFSILSIFPAFQPWQAPMACFVLVTVLAGLAAVRCQTAPARFALSLLPGITFFFMELRPLLLFPAAAWLYVILVLTMGNFAMPIHEYRQAFRLMVLVSLFFTAANLANVVVSQTGRFISVDSLVYLAAFAVLGVISLRSMQMEVRMDWRWRLANALTVILVPLAAVCLSLALYALLVKGIPVVSFLMAPLAKALMWLFARLFPGEASAEELPVDPLASPPPGLPANPMNEQGFGEIVKPDDNLVPDHFHLPEQAAQIGGYIALALAVLVGVWLVVRLARRNRPVKTEDEPVYETSERHTLQRRKKRPRAERETGNARQVRKIYREYLDFLRDNGLRLEKADTSRDVLTESEGAAADVTLRRIYLKARYGSDETVTREDVTLARRCLAEIKQGSLGPKA